MDMIDKSADEFMQAMNKTEVQKQSAEERLSLIKTRLRSIM